MGKGGSVGYNTWVGPNMVGSPTSHNQPVMGHHRSVDSGVKYLTTSVRDEEGEGGEGYAGVGGVRGGKGYAGVGGEGGKGYAGVGGMEGGKGWGWGTVVRIDVGLHPASLKKKKIVVVLTAI